MGLTSFRIRPICRFLLLIEIFSLYPVLCFGGNSPFVPGSNSYSQDGFIENGGQIVDQAYNPNKSVKYLFNEPRLNVQLRQGGFSYDTYTISKDTVSYKELPNERNPKVNQPQKIIYHFHRVDIVLVNCNRSTQITAIGPSKEYFNYFTEGTPRKGITHVHYYNRVIYKNIYPDIDLEFYVSPSDSEKANGDNSFEYRFIIHPGGNVNDIKLLYKGANYTSLQNNRLIINVVGGDFIEKIPASYIKDTRHPIDVKYSSFGDNTYGFVVAKPYSQVNRLKTDIIIDPTPCLDWGTYYGTGIWFSKGIAVDSAENVYVTGETDGTSYIATAGAYQSTYMGNQDAFIAKFNPSGSSLLWGTYYGGTGLDWGSALVLDKKANIYVTGHTESFSNIATPGAYQIVNSGANAYIAKFDSTGSNLLWGTYYGGSGITWSNSIALDKGDSIYITGNTYSTSNIATPGAYQAVNKGNNAFVAKFNPTGSALLWGTYYGGTVSEEGWGITVDNNDNVYITGDAYSGNNDVTPGAYQTTMYGTPSAFIAKFNPTGSSLLWGTYYGGGVTFGGDIALDPSDKIYITGSTQGNSHIATPGAYQYTLGGTQDIYIAKFNNSGTSLLWGTYYGGTGISQGLAIAVDSGYNVYVTGSTGGSNNIATAGTYHTKGGAYIGKFNSLGAIVWGTYYGATGYDEATGIALDNTENVYITGPARSTDSIATPGAYDTINKANGDSAAYVAKFGCNTYCNLAFTNILASSTSICQGDSTTLSVSGGNGKYKYLWSPGALTSSTIKVNPLSTTTYTLTTKDTVGDCVKDTSVTIVVSTPPNIILKGKDTVCSGVSTTLIASGGTNYNWSTGQTTSSINVSPMSDSIYYLHVQNGACYSDTSIDVVVKPLPVVTVAPNQAICRGDSTLLSATGGGIYSWTPALGLSSSNISNPLAYPQATTTYTVTVTKNGCSTKDSVQITVNPLPAVLLTANSPICNGDSSYITVSGGISYMWNTGDTTSSISVKPNSTVTYSVQVSNGTCIKDTEIAIIVNPVPTAAISGNTSICLGALTTLVASGGGSYLWSNGATTNSITISPSSITTYSIVVDSNGCKDTANSTVVVNPLPMGFACCDTTLNYGQTTTLTASGGGSYSWAPTDGLNCSNCSNPICSPTQNTTYTVTISSDSGCSVTQIVTVDINCNIFIPDAFSPNNDGQNDILYVRGACIKSMNFIVYDRWGNKMFESNGLNNGWDGDFKGQPMNTGTYVYFLRATLFDGSIIKKKGNVTLVR